jgi:DNA-binding response OmpR family regulator
MTVKKNILVVDDEHSLRIAICAQLKEQGYGVSSAEDGEVAIEMLRSQTFDLILLDLNMPNVDGFEVLRFAKKKHPKTKAVMMTGFADLNNALDSRGLGADHFIAKPFERKELLSVIHRLLRDV